MQKLPNSIDMRRAPDTMSGEVANYNSNPYPWGLCLTLCNEELDKLGLKAEDCAIGDLLNIDAIARVTSVSCNESEGSNGPNHRIEMQITHFIEKPEPEATDDETTPKRSLYKK